MTQPSTAGTGPGTQPPAAGPDTELLEASAGTGKTFAIASRVTRVLALGQVRADQLLLVTFGRSATEELGERVRSHLHTAAAALAGTLGGDTPDATGDIRDLCTGEPARLRDRWDRLRTATASFDEIAITTTHTFCSRMLRALGVLADFDPRWQVNDDATDLMADVVEDTYLALTLPGRGPSRQALRLGRLQEIAEAVRTRSDIDVRPDSFEAEVARELNAEVRRRRLLGGLLDYDDLQTFLRDTLTDPVRGPRAVDVLRRRFRIVLVDEFQDTDPVQWQILQTAFHGQVRLILVGDPKQAIYGFRGGDIGTYLRAARTTGRRLTLPDNWRSDADVVHGVGTLLGGLALGDPAITVTPVQARHSEPRVRGAGPAVRVRHLDRASLGVAGDEPVPVGDGRPLVATDVARTVADLLDTAELRDGNPGETGPWRRLRPRDIAVLTHTAAQGTQVRTALGAAGLASIGAGDGNVLGSQAARDWLVLLTCLQDLGQDSTVRELTRGQFVGWTLDGLAAATDPELVEVTERATGWAEVLTRRGVLAMFDTILTRTDLVPRVLAQVGGERQLTDLRHVADLLDAHLQTHRTGLAGLSSWLRAHLTTGPGRGPEHPSRLDADTDAVRVLTVHSAKGLEFPVVLHPYAADRGRRSVGDILTTHLDGRTVIDLHGRNGDRALLDAVAEAEAGEDLRLLYVALTRARCRLITWWWPASRATDSPLHRVLFADRDPSGMLARHARLPGDAAAEHQMRALAAASGGTIGYERVPRVQAPAPVVRDTTADQPLQVRTFTRDLDLRWRRTSYTGLTAQVHEAYTGAGHSEPEHPGIQDEPQEEDLTPVATPVHDLQPSPMADLPGGTGFGTVVHAILEHTDPTAADLPTRLHETTRNHARLAALTPDQTRTLAQALHEVLHTPLGPVGLGRTLADIHPRDRLCELDFELPLAGGDQPGHSRTLTALADLMAAHLPPDDPLAGYPDLLRAPGLGETHLRGYLVGSLDAVLRLAPPGGGPARFVVVDYKTNRLASPQQDLLLEHYTPAAMASAMLVSHYPLQALLYGVALHRYLRWRQPGYHPGTHLGGVLYLFLRGMAGPDTPVRDGTPLGVFGWRPDPVLVTGASDLLAGHR